MKKYNKDKRASYKAHTRSIKVYDGRDEYDTHDTRIKIKIHIRYDGQRHTRYDKGVFIHKRQSKEQRYINTLNAINDIFPEINGTHNRHTYIGTAPYRKYPKRDNTPEGIYKRISERAHEWHEHIIDTTPPTIHKDTRTVKCIIMNDKDNVIYIGKIRRTRIVNITYGTIDITLHKGERTMTAHERAVDPDRIIHGVTVREIKAHEVEIYYV